MAINLLLAFISGLTIVLTRTFNAHLGARIGTKQSTLANYITGFTGAFLIFLATGAKISMPVHALSLKDIFAFTGGLSGVIVVALASVLVLKMPSYMMTLLLFLGQLLMGMIIDYAFSGIISYGKLAGGLLIAIGLLISLPADFWHSKFGRRDDAEMG